MSAIQTCLNSRYYFHRPASKQQEKAGESRTPVACQKSILPYSFNRCYAVCLLRKIIFDMLICSLDGKCSSCSKRAKAIRKEQSLVSRFTMLYIGEHLRSEYRTPYKIYMTLNALYMIWIIGNVIWVIAF